MGDNSFKIKKKGDNSFFFIKLVRNLFVLKNRNSSISEFLRFKWLTDTYALNKCHNWNLENSVKDFQQCQKLVAQTQQDLQFKFLLN